MKQAKGASDRGSFQDRIARKEQRMLKARHAGKDRGVWKGLGMMGIVGWSVAVPALLCIAIGVWIDRHYRSGYSWTIMLLFIGIIIGCVNAWYWVNRERKGE